MSDEMSDEMSEGEELKEEPGRLGTPRARQTSFLPQRKRCSCLLTHCPHACAQVLALTGVQFAGATLRFEKKGDYLARKKDERKAKAG